MLPIKVPPLGESIVEATVSRWQKKEGDAVAAGDTLVELETDKITVEVPALKPGVLTKQAKKEGEIVHVDDVLGEIDEAGVGRTGDAGSGKEREAGGGKQEAEAKAAASAPAPSQSRPAATQQPAQATSGETVKSSPAARRIADGRL
jgi:2-oxoglutarate dehydrogenase E2 component (dihydrolipoamide succinyltransferase)